jgi:hypothetical protein
VWTSEAARRDNTSIWLGWGGHVRNREGHVRPRGGPGDRRARPDVYACKPFDTATERRARRRCAGRRPVISPLTAATRRAAPVRDWPGPPTGTSCDPARHPSERLADVLTTLSGRPAALLGTGVEVIVVRGQRAHRAQRHDSGAYAHDARPRLRVDWLLLAGRGLGRGPPARGAARPELSRCSTTLCERASAGG